MARALQKHVARQQDQTFADWFAELASWRASAGLTSRTRRQRSMRFGAAVRRRHKPCTWWD